MEYLPGIHSLETSMGPRPLFQYILHQERTLLIDTGLTRTPDEVIFPYLRQLGIEPDAVDIAVITHGDVDHFGGNDALRRAAPRCLIVSHRFDREWASDKEVTRRERYQMFERDHGVGYDQDILAWIMGLAGPAVPVDLAVTGGESIRLGPDWSVEVLHAPGHTPGHLIVWDERNRAVFTGEAALGLGLRNSAGRYFSPPPYYDLEAYRSTLDKMAALQPEYLFTSHFGILEGGAVVGFLEESRDYVARADEAIAAVLARVGRDGLTLKEMCREVDGELGPYDSAEELGPVVTAHLRAREKEGKVVVSRVKDGPPRWVPVG